MSYLFHTLKMFIAFKHKYKRYVMELEEFKSQPFYTPERFGEVKILDFAYISSKKQLIEYKKQINKI